MSERKPTVDEWLEQAFEEAQPGGGAADVDLVLNEPDDDRAKDDEDDEDLADWLAERDAELRERAFAAADQFADAWPPKPSL